MGFLGQEPVHTPVLDRFSSQSLFLPQAVSTAPICSPYRACLMTGQYPFRHGVTANCSGGRTLEMSQAAVCWSDVLAQQGYSLGYIGKWHLDAPRKPYVDPSVGPGGIAWNEWCPPERRHGFDFWYAYGSYNQHLRPLYWSTHASREEYHFVDQWEPERDAEVAIRYLKNDDGSYRRPDAPFALVVSMNPPHPPYSEVPEEYVAQYTGLPLDELCRRANIPPPSTKMGQFYRQNIRNYYGMVTGVDEQFGRILAALEETGQAENTIVVFTSDHGNCLGIHQEEGKNNIYEESFGIPFLIRWPGRIHPGANSLLLSSPDIHPTLLGLMGFSTGIPSGVQGADYSRTLLGQKDALPSGQLYYRANQARGWRDTRYSLEVGRREGGGHSRRLFDRETDPYQLQDIADTQPDVVASLQERMRRELKRLGDRWTV